MILEAIGIGAIGAVAIFIAKNFPFSKSPDQEYREFLMSDSYKEVERENNVFKQEIEDLRIGHEIALAASDRFFDEVKNYGTIWCYSPRGFIYEIHDEATAKYKKDISKYIEIEYQKLRITHKELYDENVALHEMKGKYSL